jgi:hypothetical protein
MTLEEQGKTRTAWDRIAPGYDSTNAATLMCSG